MRKGAGSLVDRLCNDGTVGGDPMCAGILADADEGTPTVKRGCLRNGRQVEQAAQPRGLDLAPVRAASGSLALGRELSAQAIGVPVPNRPPGFCVGCPERPVFAAIKLMQERRPQLRVSVLYGLNESLMPAVKQGEIDFAEGISALQVQSLEGEEGITAHNGDSPGFDEIAFNTGSIDTETGEIALINDAEALDEAIAIDNATGFINTIAPMRVTGIVNAAKKFRVIPTNLKRGKNHPYLVLTAAIVMVAIGGLTVAAFMLHII